MFLFDDVIKWNFLQFSEWAVSGDVTGEKLHRSVTKNGSYETASSGPLDYVMNETAAKANARIHRNA